MLHIEPLHPLFAAEVTGLDIGGGVSDADAAMLREAYARFAVLIFPRQPVTDEAQIAFSERFGPLETTRAGAKGAGGKLIVLTNTGPDGRIAPPTDRQVLNNRANQSWHHDSSFKPVPARASMAVGAADSRRGRRHRVRQHARRLGGAAGGAACRSTRPGGGA